MTPPAQTLPIRVLVADDSVDFRNLLCFLLGRDERFEVVAEANDGVEALELAEKHRPDVVLLDIAMPRLDGLQTLPALKEKHPEMKVVVLSSFGAVEMQGRTTNSGADAYVEKGESLQKIGETVVRVFET